MRRFLSFLLTLSFIVSALPYYTASAVSTFDWAQSDLLDYSYAGYKAGAEGIPAGTVPEGWITVNADDFSGNTDTEKIQNAIDSVPAETGAVIMLSARNYDIATNADINKSIIINRSNIILRGTTLNNETHTTITMKNNNGTYGAIEVGTVTQSVDRVMYLRFTAEKGSNVLKVKIDNDSLWRYQDFLAYYRKTSLEACDVGYVSLKENLISVADKKKVLFGDQANEVTQSFFGGENNVDLGELAFYFSELHKVVDIIQNSEYDYDFILAEPVNANFTEGAELSNKKKYENIGIEDITFIGNHSTKFVHSNCLASDYGWHGITVSNVTDSWISNVNFINFNSAIKMLDSCRSTINNVVSMGAQGHFTVRVVEYCTNILVMNCIDYSDTFHGPSVGEGASGTVFLNCEFSSEACIDLHSSNPYMTLYDNASGGFNPSRNGGDYSHRPNHLTDLTLWNYENTGSAVDFDTWLPGTSSKCKTYLLPSVIGVLGNSIRFDSPATKLKYYTPEPQTVNNVSTSLYLMQLEARLGVLPAWAQQEALCYTERLYNDDITLYYTDRNNSVAPDSIVTISDNQSNFLIDTPLSNVSVYISEDQANCSYSLETVNGVKHLTLDSERNGNAHITLSAGYSTFSFIASFENREIQKINFWKDSCGNEELPIIYNSCSINHFPLYNSGGAANWVSDNASISVVNGTPYVTVSLADTLAYVAAYDESGALMGAQYFYKTMLTEAQSESISFEKEKYDIRENTPTRLNVVVYPPMATVDYSSSDYTTVSIDQTGVVTGIEKGVVTVSAGVGNAVAQADVMVCVETGIDPEKVVDYSYAGYMAGQESVPTVTTQAGITTVNADSCTGNTDMEKIQNAIDRVSAMGGGIVQLSARDYNICTPEDSAYSLTINSDNVILRGKESGTKKTVLRVHTNKSGKGDYESAAIEIGKTEKTVSNPIFLTAEGTKGTNTLSVTVSGEQTGRYNYFLGQLGKTRLELEDINKIQIRQTIKSNDYDAKVRLVFGGNGEEQAEQYNYSECCGNIDLFQNEYHDVTSIEQTGTYSYIFTLSEPLNTNFFNNATVYIAALYENIGIQDLTISSNVNTYTSSLKGWQAISMQFCRDSYISNVVFDNFSIAASIENSFRISAVKCNITGENGKVGIIVRNFSTNCFVGEINDSSGGSSGPSVGKGANGTVFFNYDYSSGGGIGLKGLAPYATLMDNVSGGMVQKNMAIGTNSAPGHLGDLTIYNFENTGEASTVSLWSMASGVSTVLPNILGMSGARLTFADTSKLNMYEPEEQSSKSLYMQQLEERMEVLPEWAKEMLAMVNDYPILRVAGKSRVNTSLEICKAGWSGENPDTIILTNGYSFADALAGGPLSYALNAPIILTSNKKTLEEEIVAQINDMNIHNVVILGGEGAICPEIEVQLREQMGLNVERIAGTSRFETAVRIAEKLAELNGNTYSQKAFVAYSHNYPDALAVSSVASILGVPILFAPANGSVNPSTQEYLIASQTNDVTILGGVGAIAACAEDNLRALGITNVNRIYGTSRYLTALNIVKAYENVFTGNDIVFATGTSFPDALAGGAFAAKKGIPVLLLNNASTPKELANYVQSIEYENIYVLGGDGSLNYKAIINCIY